MLIDTNIFMEVSHKRKDYRACLTIFNAIHSGQLKEDAYISRFALGALQAMISQQNPRFMKKIHLLIQQKRLKVFESSIDDDLIIAAASADLHLDFDDALQFVAANKLGTCLVTYDKDFAKTGLETKTPQQIIEENFS